MKKYFPIIAALLIVPSVAFASWWNPTTWGIFSFLFHNNPPVEIISATTTLSSSTPIDVSTSTEAIAISSTPKVNVIVKKTTPILQSTTTTTPKTPVAPPVRVIIVPISTSTSGATLTSTATEINVADKGVPYKGMDNNWYYPNAWDTNGTPLRAPTPPGEFMATSGPMATITATSGDMIINKIQPNIVDKQRLQSGEQIKLTLKGSNFAKYLSYQAVVANTGESNSATSNSGAISICGEMLGTFSSCSIKPDSVADDIVVFTIPADAKPEVVSDSRGNIYLQYNLTVVRSGVPYRYGTYLDSKWLVGPSSVSFTIPVI